MEATQEKMNFFLSMLSEDGKVSSKRVIAFAYTVLYCLLACYTLHWHYSEDLAKFWGDCITVQVMLLVGVATTKDIIALRTGSGNSVNKQKEKENV
ncbi:MAG: hypothetical protein EBX40_00510 [Gammaproteobacteria bacterium]|nr:hypothetical protein [Gammaproteobacteria bacterium]